MHPGEPLPEVAFAVAIEGRIKSFLRHGVPPQTLAEVLAPGVEAGAVAPGGLDHGREAAVAARQHALEDRLLRIIPAQIQPRPARHLFEQLMLGLKLGRRLLPRPLERSVRFGYVIGGGDSHARAAADNLSADLFHLRRPVDDALNVRHGFSRQADHEVELDGRPALLEGVARSVEQVLFIDDLADRIAQTLRAGFRGKRH